MLSYLVNLLANVKTVYVYISFQKENPYRRSRPTFMRRIKNRLKKESNFEVFSDEFRPSDLANTLRDEKQVSQYLLLKLKPYANIYCPYYVECSEHS